MYRLRLFRREAVCRGAYIQEYGFRLAGGSACPTLACIVSPHFHLLLRVGKAESRSKTISQDGNALLISCHPASVTDVWYRFSAFRPDIDFRVFTPLSVT